eukprot:m.311823 g.311823  ORF g.311823 m.311823 type:complete len:296 (+) comp157351_c0_seq1:74-961(+)
MSKSIVFVMGTSGFIGRATVKLLSAKYADKLDIRAGVRAPEKAATLQGLPGVTIVQADMGKRAELATILASVDAAFIATPGHGDRVQLVTNAAEAAKDAGVKFLLVLSGLLAELTDTLIGKQQNEMEANIRKLGIPSAVLRLPSFVDNFFSHKDTIKNEGTFYGPADPDMPFALVVVADAGEAAADILAKPDAHAGKIYKLASDRLTNKDIASVFASVLGKEVKYVRVSYDAAKQAFMERDVPEWQADGVLELFELIDAGSPVTYVSDLGDYQQITGKKPTDLKMWLKQVADVFK